MNTANLQLEGLYPAIAAVNNALVTKGLLKQEEMDKMLRTAKEAAISDYRVEELSPTIRDAVSISGEAPAACEQQRF